MMFTAVFMAVSCIFMAMGVPMEEGIVFLLPGVLAI